MHAVLCPGPVAGAEALRSSPNSCFCSFQMSDMQEQGNWSRIFEEFPYPLGTHITLASRLGEKKKNKIKATNNCVHLSSQLMYMAEILGLFLPTFSSGQNSQLGYHPPLGMYLLCQVCRISSQRINCFLLNLCALLSLANILLV